MYFNYLNKLANYEMGIPYIQVFQLLKHARGFYEAHNDILRFEQPVAELKFPNKI